MIDRWLQPHPSTTSACPQWQTIGNLKAKSRRSKLEPFEWFKFMSNDVCADRGHHVFSVPSRSPIAFPDRFPRTRIARREG